MVRLLINHVPKPIKDGASKAFKTFKDKVMGLYNRVTSSTGNQTRIKEPKPFKPIKLEQAFGGAYRSYRVNGKPKMDVDTFFNRIRKELIELIKRELKTRTSARIQTTAWIRFVRNDEEGQERVELAFNSLMTSVYRGSEPDQIVDGMITNMKFQIENPALLNRRFVFNEFLYLDVNFHQLNLMRGSSYLPLPDWLARKKAIVNPHKDDEECFKWLVLAVEKVGMKDPQRVSNLRKFMDNYNWSGLEFPFSIKDIGKFETKNNISVNILAVEGRERQKLQMLLNFISIILSLLSFSEIFTNLIILLKQPHSLSVQLIWLALHNDRDFLYFGIVKLACVSCV